MFLAHACEVSPASCGANDSFTFACHKSTVKMQSWRQIPLPPFLGMCSLIIMKDIKFSHCMQKNSPQILKATELTAPVAHFKLVGLAHVQQKKRATHCSQSPPKQGPASAQVIGRMLGLGGRAVLVR